VEAPPYKVYSFLIDKKFPSSGTMIFITLARQKYLSPGQCIESLGQVHSHAISLKFIEIRITLKAIFARVPRVFPQYFILSNISAS
jgi:hypothetical protein